MDAISVLAAPFVGSFLGVLIRRLPRGRGVLWGRSACEACGHALGVADLLPLASFLALRGRCRFCGGRIAGAHLAIELAALAVPLSALLAGITGMALWVSCGLGWALLALAWIDALHFWLPDALTLPLLLAGLAAAWLDDPAAVPAHAAGAAAGYLAFRGIALAYRALRRRDGLGQGDAKLLAAAGAWLGWAALPVLVLLAAGLGLAWALLLWLRGGLGGRRLTAATVLPFGPALALATWLLWLGVI